MIRGAMIQLGCIGTPYTSANTRLKETIPKNSLLTYHFLGIIHHSVMFVLGGILLKSFDTSLGQRLGPRARSLCVGWHTWHQLPDGYHGCWGWMSVEVGVKF